MHPHTDLLPIIAKCVYCMIYIPFDMTFPSRSIFYYEAPLFFDYLQAFPFISDI